MEKLRNFSSHREHRTFRYKDKPSAHTVQRTSPSPCVTGPCCHVLRVTHQTNVFFRSVGVFTGNYGQSPIPSLSLTFGAEYSLVGISYHLPVGLSAERNHFTSQFRSSGRWIKYDCLDRGITSSSPEFNPSWNQASIHMVVYLKTYLAVAAQAPSESDPSPPSSPSERIANNGYNTGTVQDEPDSPSGRNDRDEPTSYRYICPLSLSGRMEHDDYWTPLHAFHSVNRITHGCVPQYCSFHCSGRWQGYVYVVSE